MISKNIIARGRKSFRHHEQKELRERKVMGRCGYRAYVRDALASRLSRIGLNQLTPEVRRSKGRIGANENA